jgi:hypothetical protein
MAEASRRTSVLIDLDRVILIDYLDASDVIHQQAAQQLAAQHVAGDRMAFSDLTRLEF